MITAPARMDLTYYIEYKNSNAPKNATTTLLVNTSDTLSVTGTFGYAEAAMTINAIDLATPYSQAECLSTVGLNECAYLGTILPNGLQHSGGPLTNASIQLVDNQLYSVEMQVWGGGFIDGAGVPGGGSASIDPTFTVLGNPGGQLEFSPGVLSAAPEPAAWLLMLVGIGAVGVSLRRREARAVVA